MQTMSQRKNDQENKSVKSDNKLFGAERTIMIELTLAELAQAQSMETELVNLRAQNAQLLADNKQWAEYSAHIENENKSFKEQLETLLNNRFKLFSRFTKTA